MARAKVAQRAPAVQRRLGSSNFLPLDRQYRHRLLSLLLSDRLEQHGFGVNRSTDVAKGLTRAERRFERPRPGAEPDPSPKSNPAGRAPANLVHNALCRARLGIEDRTELVIDTRLDERTNGRLRVSVPELTSVGPS